MRHFFSSLILFALVIAGCAQTEPGQTIDDTPQSQMATRHAPLSANCTQSTGMAYNFAEYQGACDVSGSGAGPPYPITLITIDGKPVEISTGNAYYVMAEAAAADGVSLQLTSGFRTFETQQIFYECSLCGSPGNCGSCTYGGGNLCANHNSCYDAACPGKSRHQTGTAVDISTGCGQFSANPSAQEIQNCKNISVSFTWLMANANSFGFYRTYAPEPWHWVYQPENNSPGSLPTGGPCPQECAPGCLPPEGEYNISPGYVDENCNITECTWLHACTEALGDATCAFAFCTSNGVHELVVGQVCAINGDIFPCDEFGQTDTAQVIDCPDETPCTACNQCGGSCAGACTPGCSPPGANGFSHSYVDADCNKTDCSWLYSCSETGGAADCVPAVCLDPFDKSTLISGSQCVTSTEYAECADLNNFELVACNWLDLCVDNGNGTALCAFSGCVDPQGLLIEGNTCLDVDTSIVCANGALDQNTECQEQGCNACGLCGPLPDEICNGVDDDCNGETDEGCPEPQPDTVSSQDDGSALDTEPSVDLVTSDEGADQGTSPDETDGTTNDDMSLGPDSSGGDGTVAFDTDTSGPDNTTGSVVVGPGCACQSGGSAQDTMFWVVALVAMMRCTRRRTEVDGLGLLKPHQ